MNYAQTPPAHMMESGKRIDNGPTAATVAPSPRKPVSLPWIERESRPIMPDDLPPPPMGWGDAGPWYELEAEDGHRLAVAFSGSGRPPELVMGWLYCWPPADFPWREPTFGEIRSASGMCGLEGCVFELPPWVAGLELPEVASGILVSFRQRGAVQGTDAAIRFSLATGIIVPQGN